MLAYATIQIPSLKNLRVKHMDRFRAKAIGNFLFSC